MKSELHNSHYYQYREKTESQVTILVVIKHEELKDID